MTREQAALLRFIVDFQVAHGRPPTAAELREGCTIHSFAALRLVLADLVALGVVEPAALDLPDLNAVSAAELESSGLERRINQLERDCRLAELRARELEQLAGRAVRNSAGDARAYADGLHAALRLLKATSK